MRNALRLLGLTGAAAALIIWAPFDRNARSGGDDSPVVDARADSIIDRYRASTRDERSLDRARRRYQRGGDVVVVHSVDLPHAMPIVGNRDAVRVASTDYTPEAAVGQTLLVVGTPATDDALSAFLADTPLRFYDGGFDIGGHRYESHEDVAILLQPNPADPTWPMIALVGNAPEAIAAKAETLRLGDDLEVWRGGSRLLWGNLSPGWNLVPEGVTVVDPTWTQVLREPGMTVSVHAAAVEDGSRRGSRNFMSLDRVEAILAADGGDGTDSPPALPYTDIVVGSTDSDRVTAAVGWLRRERAESGPTLGMSEATDVDVHLYPSAEVKAAHTGDVTSGHLIWTGTRWQAHIALEQGIRGEERGTLTRLLAREHLGVAAFPGLENAIAAHRSGSLGERSHTEWAGALHSLALVPGAWEVLTSPSGPVGALERELIAAAFFDFLVGAWGIETILSRYAGWEPDPMDAAALERGWQGYLDRLVDDVGMRSPRAGLTPPILGANFTQEGFGADRGYLSADSDRALARLRGLGANTVAVIPYGFLPGPRESAPIRWSSGPGGESDEAVAHVAKTSAELGLSVIVKTAALGVGKLAGGDLLPTRGGVGPLLRGVPTLDPSLRLARRSIGRGGIQPGRGAEHRHR